MGYDSSDRFNPWRRYIVGLPAWLEPYINNLHEMRFGKGYFVYATEATTLYLPHGTQQSLAAIDEEMAAELASMPQIAPATYYGEVEGDDTFTPTADMLVQAMVDDTVCGQGYTQEADGKIVYAIDVSANEAGIAEGCGTPGSSVTFVVGEKTLATLAAWDNTQPHELSLQSTIVQNGSSIYLPLVIR
jgi:hypothetical protein